MKTSRFIQKLFYLQGLSLLKLKNYEMTAYLGELTVLMSKMMKGESITVEPSVKRALKHRVVCILVFQLFLKN